MPGTFYNMCCTRQVHTVHNVRILHIVHDAGDMNMMGEGQRGGERREEEGGGGGWGAGAGASGGAAVELGCGEGTSSVAMVHHHPSSSIRRPVFATHRYLCFQYHCWHSHSTQLHPVNPGPTVLRTAVVVAHLL